MKNVIFSPHYGMIMVPYPDTFRNTGIIAYGYSVEGDDYTETPQRNVLSYAYFCLAIGRQKNISPNLTTVPNCYISKGKANAYRSKRKLFPGPIFENKVFRKICNKKA